MPHALITYDEAYKRLHERWDHGGYWTLLDARDALQIALSIWQAATSTWTARVVVPVVPGDPFVPVPGLAQVTAVRWQGLPLIRTSIAELGHMRPGWRADAMGDPGVPVRPRYWAPVGLTTVALWPASAEFSSLECDGVGEIPTAALVGSGAGYLDLSELQCDAVFDLAAWWGAGKATTHEQDKYQPGLDRFVDAAQHVVSDAATLRSLETWSGRQSDLRAPARAAAAPAESPA